MEGAWEPPRASFLRAPVSMIRALPNLQKAPPPSTLRVRIPTCEFGEHTDSQTIAPCFVPWALGAIYNYLSTSSGSTFFIRMHTPGEQELYQTSSLLFPTPLEQHTVGTSPGLVERINEGVNEYVTSLKLSVHEYSPGTLDQSPLLIKGKLNQPLLVQYLTVFIALSVHFLI